MIDLFRFEAYGIRGRIATSILSAERGLPVVDSGMKELGGHEIEGWIYGRDLPVLGKCVE